MYRILACIVLAAAAAAQSTFPHIVLTQQPGAPAAQLVEVHPTLGTVQPLGSFASDGLPPLALAVDPYDGALLVALELSTTASTIVRLVRTGGGLVEFPLTPVVGRVSALEVVDHDLIVVVDAPFGGVHRVPRRGGALVPVFQWGNLTAIHGYGASSQYAMLAITGRPGTPEVNSGTVLVDVGLGVYLTPPDSFPNPNNLEISGVIDLPTAIPRQLLSFSDGSFALFAGLISGTPQPVSTSVAIPPGGAVAMHPSGPYSVAPIALGGAPFPYLYSIDAFSGVVTVLSVALPGAPMDFAYGLDTAAHSEVFSDPCGPIPLAQMTSGAPQLGTTFLFDVFGPASTLVVIAAGLDDFAFGALPVVLPGGCLLEVSPDFVAAHVTSAVGLASQPLAIPASPTFVGTVVFSQWAAIGPTGFSTSDAAARWIGF